MGRPDQRNALVIRHTRDADVAAGKGRGEFVLQRATPLVEPVIVLALRLVAHAEQLGPIVIDDEFRDFPFRWDKDRRSALERPRVERVEGAAIVLLARDDPQRVVVGGKLAWVPGLLVAV